MFHISPIVFLIVVFGRTSVYYNKVWLLERPGLVVFSVIVINVVETVLVLCYNLCNLVLHSS